MGQFATDLNNKLKHTEKHNYVRSQFQTFMSSFEWRNVEMSQELAKFMTENHSMFQFPYFSQTLALWSIIAKSFLAARQYDRLSTVALSEYGLMALFIGTFTTMEWVPKGVLGFFVRPFLNADNPTVMQQAIAAYLTQYANDLQTIPFYDQDYAAIRARLRAAYQAAPNKTWGDWFSWKWFDMELFGRRLVSKPLHNFYHDESNIVPPTTDVLVKINIPGQLAENEAKAVFKSQLATVENVQVAAHPLSAHEHVYVKQSKKGTHTSVYALVHTPRYAAFIPAVKAMSDKKIQTRFIAGQERVQIKCVTETAAAAEAQDRAPLPANTKRLYAYGDNIHPNYRIRMFDAPCKNLQQTVDSLSAHSSIKFIHNF